MGKVISRINSMLTVEYLLREKENQYFERKRMGEKESQPAKIANELVGMLNADGGVLVLGISDNSKEIDDLKQVDVDLLNRYRKIVFEMIEPSANIKLEEVELETGQLIFIYHVESDYERVFHRKDNSNVFLRIADSIKGPLSLEEIRKLEYDKSIRKFEDEIVETFDVDDFRTSTLKFYKNKLHFEEDFDDLLINRNLAIKKDDNILYKNSAILLFAENPDKYIPNAIVRYVRYAGTKQEVGAEHNVIKDERFEGSIPRLIGIIKRFLETTFNEYYFLDINTGRFNKVPEYPKEAWLEGVVNALTHRSYNLQGNPIHIKHFDDRLEISNSGPLPSQVTVENIKTERYARNPRIARVLTEFGYVRELNEGVSRIYKSMEDSMLSEPEYKDENNIVTLTLRNNIARHRKAIPSSVMDAITNNWEKYNPTEKEIIRFLFINNQVILTEIAEAISVTPKTLRIYLNKFISNGILEKKTEKQRDANALYAFKGSFD
jgi:ATP-dependent DNA helicase RecG